MDQQPSAMPLFGKSPKSPAEIVKNLKENLAHLEKMDAGDSKKCEKVSNDFPFVCHIFLYFRILELMILLSDFFSTLQVAEEVSKNLASLKEILTGTGDKEPQTEAVAQLAQELYNTNLLIALIANLQRIDFEVWKMSFLLR